MFSAGSVSFCSEEIVYPFKTGRGNKHRGFQHCPKLQKVTNQLIFNDCTGKIRMVTIFEYSDYGVKGTSFESDGRMESSLTFFGDQKRSERSA